MSAPRRAPSTTTSIPRAPCSTASSSGWWTRRLLSVRTDRRGPRPARAREVAGAVRRHRVVEDRAQGAVARLMRRSGSRTTTRSFASKFRRTVVERLTPMMAAIIRQGRPRASSRSRHRTTPPGSSCRSSSRSTSRRHELFLAREARAISLDDVRVAPCDAQVEALGTGPRAPTGSLVLVDESVLHEWFD